MSRNDSTYNLVIQNFPLFGCRIKFGNFHEIGKCVTFDHMLKLPKLDSASKTVSFLKSPFFWGGGLLPMHQLFPRKNHTLGCRIKLGNFHNIGKCVTFAHILKLPKFDSASQIVSFPPIVGFGAEAKTITKKNVLATFF